MINFNGIDACAIIFIFALSTYAVHTSDNDLFNVGTVLFTSNDINKKRWSKSSIDLLQARRCFQNVIPAPCINCLNEDYVNNLLSYLTNTITTLKREALDPGISEVMEKALSDVIGGYLKVWVLPVTKLTYYAGELSQENAIKTYNLYQKIKNTLNTDGNGWRKPSHVMLNSIAYTVIPYTRVPHTRSLRHPCEPLAYYEQSDTGLKIPTPYINWKEDPYSMFLPIKNASLVKLDSPSSSEALLKYYDTAESCCQSKSPDVCDEFNTRFQNWLSNNVVPHIHDDKLYVAFGGLLRLLNKTNSYFHTTTNLYGKDYDKWGKQTSLLSRLPSCMMSSKFVVLILLIELIWCVPALFYLICSRRKTGRNPQTKYFVDTFKRHKWHIIERINNRQERNNNINNNDSKDFTQINLFQFSKTDTDIKHIEKTRGRHFGVDIQCPSYKSQHSIGQVTSVFSDLNRSGYQCESVTLINEKVAMDTSHSSKVRSTVLPVSNDTKNIIQTKSYTNVHKFEILTKIKDNIKSNTPCVKSSSSNKSINIKTPEVSGMNEVCMNQKYKESKAKDHKAYICPCSFCVQQYQRDMEAMKIAKPKENSLVRINNNLPVVNNVRNLTSSIKLSKVQSKVYAPKNVKRNQSKASKLNSGEPLLEIRIERPAAEITVDVSKSYRRKVKPSKIPKLASTTIKKEENTKQTLSRNLILSTQQTSKVVNKRSMDDADVKKKVRRNKMNVTL